MYTCVLLSAKVSHTWANFLKIYFEFNGKFWEKIRIDQFVCRKYFIALKRIDHFATTLSSSEKNTGESKYKD